MLIHVCVRQTLDWRDEAYVRAHLKPAFRQKVEMWNATFTMPYYQFRVWLKDIAADSVRRVEGAVISNLFTLPESAVVIPIDDDDWLAPDAAVRIERHLESSAVGVLWTPAVLEHLPLTRRARRLAGALLRRPDSMCKTNNYAIRCKRHLIDLALNHMEANTYYVAHPDKFSRIEAPLAIQNRSLASQTTLAFLRPTIGRQEILRLYRAHRRMYANWKPRPGLEWAAPFVARMNELMAEVSIK